MIVVTSTVDIRHAALIYQLLPLYLSLIANEMLKLF